MADQQQAPLQESEIGPVFIVGMNGSGTTMLRESIGRHSQLYGFPRETRVMPHVIKAIQALGDLNDDDHFKKAWELASGIPVVKLVNHGERPPMPDDWHTMPRTTGAIFDRLFRYFAAQEGKKRWCEKSPQHIQQMPLLLDVFPDAKFIHVIRDGRAGAASFHRRWRRTPRLTLYRWKKIVGAGREQGKQVPERYFEVQYEQLTQDPDHWMREICNFLELPYEPAVLGSRNPQNDRRGTEGKIGSREETWRAYFSDKEMRRMERIAGAYLKLLGYKTYFEQGDVDPSALRRRFWRIKDSVRAFMLHVQHKLKGSQKPWSQILTQPLQAIRQARMNDY